MISIKGLSKSFGKKPVVENVTLQIQPKAITSFIGPNGAGKSTLLSMVSRLLDADTGEEKFAFVPDGIQTKRFFVFFSIVKCS